MNERRSGWLRVLRAACACIAALLFLLAAAAAALGLIPANADWVEAERGVTVFVTTNGVHTGIVMPLDNEIMDWRRLVPASDVREPGESSWVAIGYGHRAFYLDTPSWAELSPATALDALAGGGEALLHVEHVGQPAEDEDQRPLVLRPDEYRRLVQFIAGHFRRDSRGGTIVVPGRGYGGNDAFYEAEGGYSFILTCNEWTGRALRTAGVRMGLWTPLEQAVMWRLR